ncbi:MULTISPECIES: hypothetical protein [Roseomonadaceae]|uniref:Uncharacterized protein n=1 Tax=Falsiroseomonas oleicola TaxID=2801474 RepID=A0ABS6H6L1_9PROT|nr:hypothetical protein [Roseomonas oleicola]MBU8543398.1 hypothetical protein [Roseomonas oleicola]
MRRMILAATAAAWLLAPAALRADEIGDAITEAGRAYAAGDLAAARTALGEASQLLQQRAADGLVLALPAAPAGWTAEDAESQAAATIFGGMTQASRSYRNGSDQTVRVEIAADNPMIAQVAMILGNPAMAGAMGRLVRIGPHRGVQGQDGNITMLLKNRYLVQIGGDAPLEAKMAFARAVDATKLPD